MKYFALAVFSFMISQWTAVHASEMQKWAEGEHANFYVVKYTPGTKWNDEVDYWQQQGVKQHKQHLDRLYDSDTLLFGGPPVDEPDAMLVIRARSKEHAKLIVMRDPMISSQVPNVEVGGWRWEMSKMRHYFQQNNVNIDPTQPYHLNRSEAATDSKLKL